MQLMLVQMHENLRERAHKTSEKTTDRQQMTSLIVKIAKGYFGSKNKKKRKEKGRGVTLMTAAVATVRVAAATRL